MNPLAGIIRQEIQTHGDIPFARFMELALYHPEHGYYERQDARTHVGRAGDFYTSVSVGPLFGELLAFQFAEWLVRQPAGRDDAAPALMEAGAHDGRLAADILNWLRSHRPELYSRLQYIVLEPSPRRRAWQAETLREHLPGVRWVDGPADLAADPVHGIIFSNELLDAFPVRRHGWDAATRTWFEWGVTLVDDHFGWSRLPGSAPGELPPELTAVLPDGYTVESSPAAETWWRTAAAALRSGHLLAIDYGLTDAGRISPARVHGTLRSYSRHRQGGDLLAHPGEQDLTAHVNFSAIQRAGESAGLVTVEFTTQPRFLTRILASTRSDATFAVWDASRLRQFQTLTHPEHLGRSFGILHQRRE